MAVLAKSASRFEKMNSTLVVIGSGDPIHFKEFRKTTDYHGELVSDTDRKVFAFLGFSSGLSGLMSIKAIPRVFSAMKSGYKQGAIQGNALQLGGAIVIDPSQTVRYFFTSQKAGDHPTADELLESLKERYSDPMRQSP